jgi:7,8-dihydropterin-6-yl-methyl-4-(beta-D-ribofuranosyl)aminobenzene 5'-phosphate synthase
VRPGRAVLLLVAVAAACATVPPAESRAPERPTSEKKTASPGPVHDAKITILSTMLADQGVGEWGFSALVETGGHRILFDTGHYPDTVLSNARALKLDLADVEDVVLSHNHDDHTGGLVALRSALRERNPRALARAHVATGIFFPRRATADGPEENPMIATGKRYEALGGTFIEHAGPAEIFSGVWLTGPVPRPHPERNWSTKGFLVTPAGLLGSWALVEDTIPEDQSLVLDTDRGLVVLAGCGHAGIVNTLEYARARVRDVVIHAAIGGFHLFNASDAALEWTAGSLRSLGVESFVGAHCTGIEATFYIRAHAGLARSTCVVGAVGASFTLGKGIDPLALAR